MVASSPASMFIIGPLLALTPGSIEIETNASAKDPRLR